MKIYWGRRRKHEEVLADIDRLEHELGLATEQLLQTRKGLPPKRGAVDLSYVSKHPAAPIMLIGGSALTDTELFNYGPGAVIPINEGGEVHFLPTMSSAVTATTRIVPKRSRVELPLGVRLQ